MIAIPEMLKNEIKEYINTSYNIDIEERIFYFTKHYLRHNLLKYSKLAKVKTIRVHDLRHSHASLLIELSFSPLLTSRTRKYRNNIKYIFSSIP